MTQPTQHLRPALFLDRDGVINVEVNYLSRPQDCILVDGIASLLRTAHALGYVICVVTNQAGIGRGLYTEEDFHCVMRHLSAELSKEGAAWDAIYFCPFHPVHGLGEYRRDSDCRKPAPGMLLRAAAEHKLSLDRSVLVGDHCSDLEAGHAAGVKRLFLFGATEGGDCPVAFPHRREDRLSSIEQELTATSHSAMGL
ncbi:MAG: D-glycero-alpha-D-manno-heptose-1,7-bisphosphate 7-phosphatase [Janthinobacterium lividum]